MDEKEFPTPAIDPQAVLRLLEQALATVPAGDAIGAVAVCTRFAIDHFLSDPRVGVYPESDAGLAAVVSALKVRVQRTWMPDLDEVALFDALEAGRPSSGSGAPHLRADRALRYSPLPSAALVALALSGQAGKVVEAQAAWTRRELAELDAIIVRHEESRRADLLTRLGIEIDERTRALGAHLSREQTEYCAASLRFDQLARHALVKYPPFAVFDSASVVLAAISGVSDVWEMRVFTSGILSRDRSSHRRAAIGVALQRLRDVVGWAFPGSLEAPGRRGKPPSLRRGALGPYRNATPEPAPAKPPKPPAAPHTWAAMVDAAASSRAREPLEHAMPFLPSLALLGACRDGAGAQDEAADRRKRRAEWQRCSVFWMMQDAHRRLAHGLRGQFGFELWGALTQMNGAIIAVSLDFTPLDGEAALEHVMASMVGLSAQPRSHGFPLSLQYAFAALQRLAAVVGQAWGLRGDMDALIAHVRDCIVRQPSAPAFGPAPNSRVLTYDELGRVLARALGGTTFVASADAYRAAAETYYRARAEAERAGRQVTLWDKLNLVTDSPAERERDDWKELRNEQGDAAMMLLDSLRTSLSQALVVYPPALVYFGLGRVLRTMQGIRLEARSSRRGTYYVVVGKEEAQRALSEWTAHAITVFGPILTPGDWLAESVCRSLAAQPKPPPP